MYGGWLLLLAMFALLLLLCGCKVHFKQMRNSKDEDARGGESGGGEGGRLWVVEKDFRCCCSLLCRNFFIFSACLKSVNIIWPWRILLLFCCYFFHFSFCNLWSCFTCYWVADGWWPSPLRKKWVCHMFTIILPAGVVVFVADAAIASERTNVAASSLKARL